MNKDQIIEKLTNCGLSVDPYRRGPLGKNIFSIAKSRAGNGLRIWFPEETEAEYEVRTDRRGKKAVLTVTEPPRIVDNESATTIHPPEFLEMGEKLRDKWERLSNQDRGLTPKEFKEKFGFVPRVRGERALVTHVPNSRFTATRIKLGFYRSSLTQEPVGYVSIFGKSKCPKTTTAFLLGVDEVKHFISILKEPAVNSVREAIASLRPEGLSGRAVRQGEWFFDPVSAELATELNKAVSTGGGRWNGSNFGVKTLESGSSHWACSLEFEGENYALGEVVDDRRGYHKPLLLDKWHRIVRNNEVRVDPEVSNYD
jgi:hypothetical protein